MTTDDGYVLWFPGLSGAGKSTVARALLAQLASRDQPVELDGDEVRTNLCQDLGFSREDRDTNIARIGDVAGKLAKHSVVALVAAIFPYREAATASEPASRTSSRCTWPRRSRSAPSAT